MRQVQNTKRRVQTFLVAVKKCLPSRCLATKGKVLFAEALPIDDRRDINIAAQTNPVPPRVEAG